MERVTSESLEWSESGGSGGIRRKHLGEEGDGDDIGCSLYELPPGEASWPYHYHTANEEALYVLDGTGTLRADGGEHDLSAGDYVSLPADESGGHRVVNDSAEPLRYLAVSTMNEPDVTVYPDAGRFGVFVGSPPGGRGERTLHGYYRIEDDVPYPE
ncbi:cupin domain-containing protein [Salarchaeum japonicum]|uniref:Cupin type-2 domain-containing protein n=1 Tax=Salarchaeum japonicum TaxID=555573 RepID=A0AAV3SZC5_9EURY|nr:cupin domain-containing protein [Salarchaeum japonicum]